ncbi:MAG: family acetyltransferase [Rhodospirillales bacterium]|nr:family acetyltransferase [Rhodospirillales bacterium]
MFDNPPTIRAARESDLARVQAIYAHYVETGAASFEITPPDLAEMTKRFEVIRARGFPYIVAEVDGEVAGYAYAGTYRARAAYDFIVEDSVYIAPDRLGHGLGRALLGALIEACTIAGYRRMIAVIGDSANAPSINLHLALGFTHAGVLPSAGFKHGRWVDSVMMQRALGEGDTTPPRPVTRL